jgi:hypothetical protein
MLKEFTMQMKTIMAGRFVEQAQAERAGVALEAAGCQRSQIAIFFVNPPGQHDRSGTQRDPDASAGAHHAGAGAAEGAAAGSGVGAVMGLVAVPVMGPGGPMVGAAIGAYVGSFAGALESMEAPGKVPEESVASQRNRDEAIPRKGGMLVAVSVATPLDEERAIAVLRAQGAIDIEIAQGTITESQWNDFNPLRAPQLISASAQVEFS